MEGDSTQSRRPNIVVAFFKRLGELHQLYLDKSTPYVNSRWSVWLLLMVVYGIRVFILQGWYIITYALGIYLLNLLLAFLTPKIDPALELDDDGPSLPTRSSEEFRPFMRRLPEFKFWYGATKAVTICMFLTFFEAVNIPVFWPILVMYFIILFTITMKRQIRHMIKYRYIPFSHGKTKYQGKEDSGKVVAS